MGALSLYQMLFSPLWQLGLLCATLGSFPVNHSAVAPEKCPASSGSTGAVLSSVDEQSSASGSFEGWCAVACSSGIVVYFNTISIPEEVRLISC